MASISIFTVLFHTANLMAFLAFLLRDQLQLRILMAVSLFMQGLYYYSIPGGPLFDPLFWKVVSFAANLLMIVLVFGGRLDFGVPEDLRPLFNAIAVLTPGQFRKLISKATRVQADGVPILIEGERPARLYYLLKGEARISKQNHTSMLQPGIFLGEIAFLSGSSASATVTLEPNAECVAWKSADLKQLMQRDSAINIALRGVFNSDMAGKLATSLPLDAHH